MRNKLSQCEDLTLEEEKWIKSLQRVCRKCPKSLWLYSNGTMHVMKHPEDGEDLGAGCDGTGVNPDNCVSTILGICSDGGDW